jgi:hypothetical protein
MAPALRMTRFIKETQTVFFCFFEAGRTAEDMFLILRIIFEVLVSEKCCPPAKSLVCQDAAEFARRAFQHSHLDIILRPSFDLVYLVRHIDYPETPLCFTHEYTLSVPRVLVARPQAPSL